eukprot:TsM_000289600 transcript=TsM_000289600 gene=TsM_000289600
MFNLKARYNSLLRFINFCELKKCGTVNGVVLTSCGLPDTSLSRPVEETFETSPAGPKMVKILNTEGLNLPSSTESEGEYVLSNLPKNKLCEH